MQPFTKTQGRYLSFIHAYTEGLGQPPAESEIAEAMRVQPPSVNGMLKTLVKKGLISKEPGAARSIEILVDPDSIPRWTKKLHCNLEIWAPADATQQWIDQRGDEIIQQRKAARHKAKNPITTQNCSDPHTVYRFKIKLRGTKPPIWRRIETHNVSLEQFHELIQIAMGWTNSHMHEFQFGETRYTHPEFLLDEMDDFGAKSYDNVSLEDLLATAGPKLKLRYDYDFGDGWEHDVVLEKIVPAETGIDYPRCVTGKLACPPEDIGGVWGYYDFVEAISDPNHERHEEMLEWGGAYDPAEFSEEEATELMAIGLPGCY